MRRWSGTMPACLPLWSAAAWIAALVTAGVSGSASAATLHVPSAYPTIQAGVDAATVGDSVVVAPGTYSDIRFREFADAVPPFASWAIVFLKAGVTVVGEGGPDATRLEIPASPDGRDIWGAVAIEQTGALFALEGFGVSGQSSDVPGMTVRNVDSVAVRHCIFEGLGGMGLHLRICEEAFVDGCRFTDCAGTGLVGSLAKATVQDCVFERCNRGVSQFGRRIDMHRCDFVENEGTYGAGMYVSHSQAWIDQCRFERNVGQHAVALFVETTYDALVAVSRCVFLENTATSGDIVHSENSVAHISGSTFSGNTAGGGSAVLRTDGWLPVVIVNNILAGSRGAVAVKVEEQYENATTAFCNVFWDNVPGNTGNSYIWSPSDFEIDPRFCDAAAGDVSLRSNSPCLPQNHPVCPTRIGALGEACPADDAAILAIVSVPGAVPVQLDGTSAIPPILRTSAIGAAHLLSADTLHVAGMTRHRFASWSDGGTRTHGITMPPGYTELEARFDTEHFLTVRTDSGGTVEPSSWIAEDAEHWLTAVPDSGYSFHWWIGTGVGHYSGPGNPVRIEMHEPITQTAYFLPDAYPLTTQADGGTVTPPSGPQLRDATVEITAMPDAGFAFAGWVGERTGSYTGPDNPAAVVMESPITQTATFETTLEMVAGAGGTVTPATGSHPAGAVVEIEAHPDEHSLFVGWKGEGAGSYTGSDNPATVTMSGAITQFAEFRRRAFAITLSLSATDPHVHTGAPLGAGNVYLWLDCGTTGGISGLEVSVGGTMSPIAFQPAPGVLVNGTPQQLELGLPSCATGPSLLGAFTVLPPGEGSLCLAASGASPGMAVIDCEPPYARFAWPQDLRVTGVRTDGGAVCTSGRGCDEALAAGAVVAAPLPPVFPLPPLADALHGGVPNPFDGSTSIRFSLSRPGRAILTVYDVTGRIVRRLVDEERPAGLHDVPWGGRNAEGHVVPAGIYFVRMESAAFSGTRKLVRLSR